MMESPKNLFEEGMEVVEIDDTFRPESPSKNKANLKREAERVSKKTRAAASAMSKKIETIPGIERVMEVLEFRISSATDDLTTAPDFAEIETHESYYDLLQELLSIVDSYRQGELNITQAQRDLMHMAAALTYLSQKLSTFQALKADAEHRLERSRSRIYVESKKAGKEEGAKISDTDAKELAKYYSDPIVQQVSDLAFIERYLYNTFHSLRNFLEMLNHVSYREVKVNLSPHQP